LDRKVMGSGSERRMGVMDWYAEAKMRQQEIMHEADVSRLLRSARAGSTSERSRAGNQFMVWLGGRLVASGKRLQAQYK
jgi:hypothetical protein